ncbi:sigma 54-interacting transcriptional regulator [bacterium]|nr:sigma 54-interacting transcriptional regulator [bacterium]
MSWAGHGLAGLKILKQLSLLGSEPGPLLIEGPTGSGKEVIINLIEKLEAPKKIIRINVAAISPSLFESEFFGHVKGAFTGADQNKLGLAQKAHDGILFLDEVEALPLNLQVKLLRFLESGEVKPVGSDTSLKVNCKLIFATNIKLEKLVEEKVFRDDLLWRISGKKIAIPPLCERKDELKEIFEYYLQKLSKRAYSISDNALNLIRNYSWPGNIRELIRVCEKVIIEAPLPVVREEDLLPHLRANNNFSESTHTNSFSELLKSFESKLIKDYFLQNNKNIESTCKALKVSRSNLYKKLKEYQIN